MLRASDHSGHRCDSTKVVLDVRHIDVLARFVIAHRLEHQRPHVIGQWPAGDRGHNILDSEQKLLCGSFKKALIFYLVERRSSRRLASMKNENRMLTPWDNMVISKPCSSCDIILYING